jgi:hypothetical protein
MNRIFISCGQATDHERRVAREICELVRGKGFDAYLAIEAQTLLDINSGIIDELKASDYYLLVNFCRDSLSKGNRGSLFSNQELAIAYALGFKRLLVVNQVGIADEGMLRYIGVNTERFNGYDDCVRMVALAMEKAAWKPGYSRQLRADGLRVTSELIPYREPTGGQLFGRFVNIDIHNHRPDVAALETTARLRRYGLRGSTLRDSDQRSPLKATARPGYTHTIFPSSHEAFDLLCVSTDEAEARSPLFPGVGAGNATASISSSPMFVPSGSGVYLPPRRSRSFTVYLNNALDVFPRPPLPISGGEWILQYQFYAIDFPILQIEILLVLADSGKIDVELISQGVAETD